MDPTLDPPKQAPGSITDLLTQVGPNNAGIIAMNVRWGDASGALIDDYVQMSTHTVIHSVPNIRCPCMRVDIEPYIPRRFLWTRGLAGNVRGVLTRPARRRTPALARH